MNLRTKLCFFGVVCVLLAFTTCDFNNPLINYIADATNNARAVEHTIVTDYHLMSNDITAIPVGETTTIKIQIRNPRNYESLGLDLEGENPGTKATVTDTDGIIVTINDPEREDIFDLTLKISYEDRPMSEYKLPKMEARYFYKDLDSLSVTPPGGGLTPDFSSAVVDYQITVAAATTSVIITAVSHSSANVKINDENSPITIPNSSDTTNITIKVTADNDDVKTYNLTITRIPKLPGANVKIPTYTGVPSATSFSISALEFSPSPPASDQLIQYTITTEETLPVGFDDDDWKEYMGSEPIKFEDRSTGTAYYVHARSKGDDTHEAGAVVTSAAIIYHSVTFDSNGESPTPATQYVWNGTPAKEPTGSAKPTKEFTPIEGLYRDKVPEYETLSWLVNDTTTVHNFTNNITSNTALIANWTVPEHASLTSREFITIIWPVIAGSSENFFLLLENNLTNAGTPQTITGVNLTIQGLEEVEINADSTSQNGARLLTLGNGATLTIGENITLTRSSSVADSPAPLITVQAGGTLNMLPGSSITGFTTSSANGTVFISGANAVFNMSGGSITVNKNSVSDRNRYIASGGVVINNGGKFNMTGGSITANTNNFPGVNKGADVTLFEQTGTSFTIGGTASVGALIMSSNQTDMPNFIIGSDWSGSVGALHLRAGGTVDTSKDFYSGNTIFTGSTTNNITLGQFRGYHDTNNDLYKNISDTHSLSTSGVLEESP